MEKLILLSNDKEECINEYMPKDSTLKRLANFFSVFSDATRIKILTALSLSEMCVNDLSVMLKINQTTVSHQLKYLKQNGVVSCERDGKIIYYSLSGEGVNNVMLNGVEYLLAN